MIDGESYNSEKNLNPNNLNFIAFGYKGYGVSVFSKQINQNYYKPSRRGNHFGILLLLVMATSGQAVVIHSCQDSLY